MERLTTLLDDGKFYPKHGVSFKEITNKLAEYEDAEENGLLVRFPCRIGSTVFFILEDSVDKDNVNGYVVSSPHKIIDACKNGFFTGQTKDFPYDSDFTEWKEIGKTVFLTKAEAESKLAEMEGEYGTT